MVSANVRLTRLLDRGFYPTELPPSFATRNFSTIRNSLQLAPTYSGSTTFFEGATFRGHLRKFGVINPVSYLALAKFIAANWVSIVDIYRLSSSSGSRPKFPAAQSDGRSITISNVATKRKSQRHLAGSYPVVVNLDINMFYGSIYTHAIPWAALGKEEAKRRFASRTLAGHWSDTLDKLVRNCNQSQTVGIAIGPDTSRIVSELILSRIDDELCSRGSGINSSQIYHNIDDYQFGVSSSSDAEDVQSKFVRAISRYELRINDFKTSTKHGLGFAPSNFQRRFDPLASLTGRTFVETFFEYLYRVSNEYTDDNVVGYALKRFAKRLCRPGEQQQLTKEYLQRLIFAAPFHARWVLPLLLGIYRRAGTNPEIRRIISWGIETSTRRNDVGSLLWFLYAAIFLDIKIHGALCRLCLDMSNSLVDISLFHGRISGVFGFNIAEFRRRYSSASFDSSSWLPLYEIQRRGWDNAPAFMKIGTAAHDAGSMYQSMAAANVQFYVPDQDIFSVEAFSGWKLSQRDFDDPPPIDFEEIDNDMTNYMEYDGIYE